MPPRCWWWPWLVWRRRWQMVPGCVPVVVYWSLRGSWKGCCGGSGRSVSGGMPETHTLLGPEKTGTPGGVVGFSAQMIAARRHTAGLSRLVSWCGWWLVVG